MESQWEVKGKTVLITGGASGLGAGKVEALLKEGAKVKYFLYFMQFKSQ